MSLARIWDGPSRQLEIIPTRGMRHRQRQSLELLHCARGGHLVRRPVQDWRGEEVTLSSLLATFSSSVGVMSLLLPPACQQPTDTIKEEIWNPQTNTDWPGPFPLDKLEFVFTNLLHLSLSPSHQPVYNVRSDLVKPTLTITVPPPPFTSP